MRKGAHGEMKRSCPSREIAQEVKAVGKAPFGLTDDGISLGFNYYRCLVVGHGAHTSWQLPLL